jgi:RNA polymerase sigma factor (sigma-70 family)
MALRPRSRGELRSITTDEFAQLYEEHALVVFAYLRRRLGHSETAADLTSETFARALENWGSYDRARGPVRAWLFGIANNVVAMTLRSGRREQAARARLGVPPVNATPTEIGELEARLDAERLGHTLESLVSDLPTHEREAVLARVIVEEDYADIARRLGVTESTVRQRVSRGLRRLSAALEGRKQ